MKVSEFTNKQWELYDCGYYSATKDEDKYDCPYPVGS
jgi:hypothetical protein